MQKKILIVEDEPNIVIPLEFLMEQNDFDVKVAITGEEAIETIESFNPDLILLDIMLPGMDGYEVCQKVRQNPKLPHTKIIFLSALARDIDIAKGMGLLADGFITKPFSISDVVDTVKNLLGSDSY
ncbi:MAG: response regulator [Pseudomonadota bacterium]